MDEINSKAKKDLQIMQVLFLTLTIQTEYRRLANQTKCSTETLEDDRC